MYHSNRMDLDSLCNHDGTSMLVYRFRFFLCIQYNNHVTRPSRKLVDKLVSLKDFFVILVEHCLRNYVLSKFVINDQMLSRVNVC